MKPRIWYNPVIMKSSFDMHTAHPEWPIAVARTPHDETVYHTHHFSELALVIKGKGVHKYQGDEREIHRGDILFIPPGHLHGYFKGNNLTVYNLLFREHEIPLFPGDLINMEGYHALCHADGVIRQQVSGTEGIRLDRAILDEMEKMLDRLNQELSLSLSGWQTGSLSLFFQIFITLCRHITGVNSSPRLIKGGEIMVFMENNYSQDLSLEQLADKAVMSVSSFQRFFRENFGTSPMGYLRELRLKKAALSLEEGRSSLAQVAQDCGFYDASHFGRLFKQYWGVTPGEYLK
jgi:AraC family L-rhamnose operon regulatory protein RhaS